MSAPTFVGGLLAVQTVCSQGRSRQPVRCMRILQNPYLQRFSITWNLLLVE